MPRAAKAPLITEVIVDDRVFERDVTGGAPVHNSWPREQLNLWYCAPVSGLNFFTNVITMRATPGDGVGRKPNVRTEPSAPWLINLDLASARTVKEGSNSLWAQQEAAGPGGLNAVSGITFKVFGDVKLDGASRSNQVKLDVTVAAPGMLLGRLIEHAFWEAGLAAQNKGSAGVPVRLAADGEDLVAAQATPFAVITTPLATVMKRCNVDSQNLYAECLLKRTAFEVTQQPGSWATGAQVVSMRLTEKLGQDAQRIRIVDGSGLSKENQVTPMAMAKWLSALQQDQTTGAAFIASMASADDKEAKIFKRFVDRKPKGNIYAKTGYIKNVVCLSGYVVNGNRTIAYSVLANDVGGNIARVKDFQEDVVMTIDNWLARQRGGN
ncbi:MAG: D-alanyl-D-alanine carboxypeptidase [Phycisphaerales bacterium]